MTGIMTAAVLAEQCQGLQYEDFLSSSNERLNKLCDIASANNMVIIKGYSDDGVQFMGAFSDQIGAVDGTVFDIDSKGVLPDYDKCDSEEEHESYFMRKPNAQEIQAIWCEKGSDYAWTFKTDIPHETFEIFEDGEKWCRGIVIDLNQLEPKKADQVVMGIPDDMAQAVLAEAQRYNSAVAGLMEVVNSPDLVALCTSTEEDAPMIELSEEESRAYRSGIVTALDLLGKSFPFGIEGE